MDWVVVHVVVVRCVVSWLMHGVSMVHRLMMVRSVMDWLMDRVVVMLIVMVWGMVNWFVHCVVMKGLMMVAIVVERFMNWVGMVCWFMVVWSMVNWCMNRVKVVSSLVMDWLVVVWSRVAVVHKIVNNVLIDILNVVHGSVVQDLVSVNVVVYEVVVECVVNTWLNRSKKFNESCSSVVTSFKVLVSCPVVLFLFNVGLDCLSVSEPSLGDSFGQVDRMLEDISPMFDGINIVIHVVTVLDSVWQHPDDITNIFGG